MGLLDDEEHIITLTFQNIKSDKPVCKLRVHMESKMATLSKMIRKQFNMGVGEVESIALFREKKGTYYMLSYEDSGDDYGNNSAPYQVKDFKLNDGDIVFWCKEKETKSIKYNIFCTDYMMKIQPSLKRFMKDWEPEKGKK